MLIGGMLVEPVYTNSRSFVVVKGNTNCVVAIFCSNRKAFVLFFILVTHKMKSITSHEPTAALTSTRDDSCFVLPAVAAAASYLKKADWNTSLKRPHLDLGKMDAPEFRLWNLINPAVLHSWSPGSQFNINGRKIIPHQCKCVGEINNIFPWHPTLTQ